MLRLWMTQPGPMLNDSRQSSPSQVKLLVSCSTGRGRGGPVDAKSSPTQTRWNK